MSVALENASVRRVRDALDAAGSPARVVELAETARTARDAAAALGVEVGAIVKSLVFLVGGRPVMALVAGDRQCDVAALPAVLGLDGKAAGRRRRGARGHRLRDRRRGPARPPVAAAVRDRREPGPLRRRLRGAGHPFYVFATTLDELARVTSGVVSETVGKA
jgi:hypothetical protein